MLDPLRNVQLTAGKGGWTTTGRFSTASLMRETFDWNCLTILQAADGYKVQGAHLEFSPSLKIGSAKYVTMNWITWSTAIGLAILRTSARVTFDDGCVCQFHYFLPRTMIAKWQHLLCRTDQFGIDTPPDKCRDSKSVSSAHIIHRKLSL